MNNHLHGALADYKEVERAFEDSCNYPGQDTVAQRGRKRGMMGDYKNHFLLNSGISMRLNSQDWWEYLLLKAYNL
uniref:Putative ovule protein n=1 Tax=Solanum chacoense TaxID=4108 RepID=A0A0V0GNH3_SOLCH